jgi:dTDP-L-rhamnose 4-epimerase
MYDMGEYCDVNVTGTARLLERIVKDHLPVRRLVLSSSRAVYGEGTHRCDTCGDVYPGSRAIDDLRDGRFGVPCPRCGEPVHSAATSEDRPLLPLSTYGWTKRSQEDLCLAAAATFGLDVAVLRYFNVYGSRQSLVNPYTGIVSIFYARLQAGRTIPLYENGTPLRDFVHVHDVARANVAALADGVPAGVTCNIGSGRAVTVTDVARAIGDALGREARFESSGEFRAGDIHACVADIERAGRALAFTPSMSLADGMAEFVAWAADRPSVDRSSEAAEALERHGLLGRSRTR